MKTLRTNRCLLYMIALALLNACSLGGLDLQENHEHEVSFADPDLNMTAWEFLNEPREDSLFAVMLSAIEHAGLEEEYTKPNRTFMLLGNTALYTTAADTIVDKCWYYNYVQGAEELDWNRVPEEDLRNLLLYHIIEGEYSYDNLGTENTEVQTLSPVEGKDKMYLRIDNNERSKITSNDFTGSARVFPARTGGLRPTNGVIHVYNQYLGYELAGEEGEEEPESE